MPDPATISTILSSIKTATNIVKTFKGLDSNIALAEIKLNVAELMTALEEAQIALIELQDTIKEKDDEIAHLRDAFSQKEDVIKHNDAYYKKDEDGKPTGEPYCLYCWDNEQRLRYLVQTGRHTKHCTACKNEYASSHTLRIIP